jgi:hypothetical protein
MYRCLANKQDHHSHPFTILSHIQHKISLQQQDLKEAKRIANFQGFWFFWLLLALNSLHMDILNPEILHSLGAAKQIPLGNAWLYTAVS